MAQDELTRLQNSLANYQAKNTSGQYANTVANLQSKINDLKGQVEFGAKTTTPTVTPTAVTTPKVTTPTVTTAPKVTTPTAGIPSYATSVPTYATPTTNQAGITSTNKSTPTPTQAPQYNFTQTPTQNAATGMNVSKTPTGGTAVGTSVVPNGGVQGAAVPPKVETPPLGVVTPPTPDTQSLSLREVATNAGLTVGNIGSIPTINGTQIDPAKAGLQLVNGSWQGTPAQIGAALGAPVELRSSVEATGRTVTYNPQTGQVEVNRIPVDTRGMINIDGRYYTTQDGVNGVIARTGGAFPVGTDLTKPVDGEMVPGDMLDNSLQAQLDEALRRNQELQLMADQLYEMRIPQEDYTNQLELLKSLQERKAPYDDMIKQILAKTFEGFDYDPDNDPMLQKAIKYADRSMMEEMNRRGILSSSITVDNMRYLREDLLPQYQDMAFQRYNQELSNNFKRIDVLQALNSDDYERYKNFISLAMNTADKITKNTVETYKDNMSIIQNALSNQIALDKQDAELKAEAYKNAWLKFKEIGYVDNEIASLTGLPVGMRSKEAEAEILARYDEYNKLAIQAQNDLDQKDYQFELDMKKIDAAKKEKDIEEAKKANAAKLYASLGNMSATQALDEISKNFGTLVDYMGSELWTLVEKLNAAKVIEDRAAADKEQNRIQNSLDAARIDTTRQQNAISNDLERQRISIAQQNADTTSRNSVSKEELEAIPVVYNDFLKSGLSFDDWFQSPSREVKMFETRDNVPTKGELLPEKVLTGMVNLLKTKGYFNAKDEADIFNPDGSVNVNGLNSMLKK